MLQNVALFGSQDGDIGKHGLPPHTTTSKLQLNYRTTKIRAEWKSYNYRIKEGTTWRLVEGVETLSRPVPYPQVVDKNREEYLRSKGSQPHSRPLERMVPVPER